MAKKSVPNGDLEFATQARSFASVIAKEPGQFEIDPADSAELSSAVETYCTALQAARHGGRSQAATRAKEEARQGLELIYRRVRNLIRNNSRLSSATKVAVGIEPRTAKPKIVPCPQEPPRLKFVRALHEGSAATPMHELSFMSLDWKNSKPEGAVRIELFVDLVPPEEEIPAHPGANLGGRPWYLRSFTRSPIKLVPPIPSVPMRVVYWARWADSLGNVGPFCATVAGWIEGGSHRYLPGGVRSGGPGKQPEIAFHERDERADRPQKYSVAVLDAQFQMLNPQRMMSDDAGALPAPQPQPRQLEGPESEAA